MTKPKCKQCGNKGSVKCSDCGEGPFCSKCSKSHGCKPKDGESKKPGKGK